MGQVQRTRKDIVKMLLKNKELENADEEQLMEILFNEPIAIDVDKYVSDNETWKDRLADKLTEICGSWGFIIWFIILISIWMGANIILLKMDYKAFDPYPFILLNLALSTISALQAPVIMMSQNRSAKKDTLRGKNDYKTDLKSELILEELHDEIRKVISNQNKIIRMLNQDDDK
ncbi:MAG: DUF1003 domain-containing protein [Bacilli bacterium]